MHSGFSEVLNPTQSGLVFMEMAEDAILAVCQVAPKTSWLRDEAPKTTFSQPHLWEPGMPLH